MPYFLIFLSIIFPALWSPELNPAGGSPTDPCGFFIIVGLEALSALTLFVLRILANNHHFAFTLDDFAFLAHGFY